MTISPNKWELDVQSYLNTCNITAAAPRKDIRDFSAGVNDLGLWNSMVCWPLRSSQNYAGSTDVFSLGGLGSFKGTMVGGPTYETDGMDFDGSDDRISLPDGSFGTGNSATCLWAFRKNNTAAARMSLLASGNNFNADDALSLESPIGGAGSAGARIRSSGAIAIGGNVVTDQWRSLLLAHDTTTGFSAGDGGALSQASLGGAFNKTGQSTNIGRMGNPASFGFDGLISAVIRIDATPTTTLNAQIYSLYKTTLGQGITFP